ncbi:MAG: polysialyltransferase family glycosyltransferase [Colwellia sp.]
MKSPANKILLISTFRHYFLGIAMALQDKQHAYHAIFIDQQYDDERNPLLAAAKALITPFKSVSCLPTRGKGLNKRAVRLRAFASIKETIDTLKPVEISTGNDRRLEFQYAMYYARLNLTGHTLGSYIEDGTGTYINVQCYSLKKHLADKYIDTPIKKLAYGLWYSRPAVLGAGKWIDRTYLTFPELVAPPVDKVPGVHLNADLYHSGDGQQIIEQLVKTMGFTLPKNQEEIVLLALPHHSIVKDMYGSVANFRKKIAELLKQEKNIYVKYHPRDLGDPYGLGDIATFLPTAVPAEIYFTTLNIKQVIGDISTAMMSAKWLKPNCHVSYIKTNSIYTKAASTLFGKMDIKEINL